MVNETLDSEGLLENGRSRMSMSVEVLKRELNSLRTGRATTALVENILVDYYGTSTPLNQLSTISTPEAQLILIQPWDREAMPEIEKAILKANIGLNPSNAGNLLRIGIPPLSQERRKELVRSLGKTVEEGKVAIRNVRRDTLDKLRALERNKSISQDETQRAQTKLQKITDAYIDQITKFWESKVEDMMKI